MAEDVIRIRLKPAQRRAVEAETGVDLEELTYPDPGGELSARFGEFDAGDILHWARAQALVIAYDRDAAAAREALERDLAQAEDDHARALDRHARKLAMCGAYCNTASASNLDASSARSCDSGGNEASMSRRARGHSASRATPTATRAARPASDVCFIATRAASMVVRTRACVTMWINPHHQILFFDFQFSTTRGQTM